MRFIKRMRLKRQRYIVEERKAAAYHYGFTNGLTADRKIEAINRLLNILK